MLPCIEAKSESGKERYLAKDSYLVPRGGIKLPDDRMCSGNGGTNVTFNLYEQRWQSWTQRS